MTCAPHRNIHAANKDGSGAGVLASADYPARLLVGSTFVYWYSGGDNQLQRVRTRRWRS
ncbi:hypothetical protein [Sorangium cellulosum]|uniref:hypothetical protein n=1 Tax=Sorangium cellulosum TaxID=56 RepID=UPI0013EE2315|nr:hypothetical protein [Sorangium cellulosum]